MGNSDYGNSSTRAAQQTRGCDVTQTQAQQAAQGPSFEVVDSFDAQSVELQPWPEFPPEDIQSGNPAHKGNVLYRDPTGRYSVGVWECPPAKFKVAYAGTETGQVLQGRATITDLSTDSAVHLKAGDRFIVPFGSTVIWEVQETFKKVYCMYEAEWDEERFY